MMPYTEAEVFSLAKRCVEVNADGKAERFIDALLVNDLDTLERELLDLYRQSDCKEEIMRFAESLLAKQGGHTV